jgi:phage recombination protein Bet
MTSPAAVQTVPVDNMMGDAGDTYDQLNLIRSVLAPDLNDQELRLFALVAYRSRLDPFAKQLYAIKRKGRVTFQTGIDGFRSSAEETNEYRGSDEPTYGPMIDKPFPHPEFATVVVHRQFAGGAMLDQSSTAYFDEFYPGDDQGFQWRKMPRVMLAKCAEAAAFRKAFPKRFSDVYTPEEMAQADAAAVATPVGPTAKERIHDRRQQIEAGPAPAAETKTVPEAGDEVDEQTGEVYARDLVSRLKRAYEEHFDKRRDFATTEQKAELVTLFAGVDRAVIDNLLHAAFGIDEAPGPIKVDRAQAVALLQVGNRDRELFIVEASTLASDAS